MRVLILRPEPQASAMAADLSARGVTAEVLAMLTVVREPGAARRITDLSPVGGLVFTSAAGVGALVADGLDDGLLGRPAVAVGPATAAAAERAGFRRVVTAGGDGAAAADTAAGLVLGDDGTIVHVAGRDMAFDVAAALRARGRRAETVTAYRTEPTTVIDAGVAAGIASGAFEAIVIASARTAAAFGRCLERAGIRCVPNTALVAVSAAAAAPLQPLFGRLVVAEAPNGESLTKAVVALAASA